MVRSNAFTSYFSSKNGSNFSSTHVGNANLTPEPCETNSLTATGCGGEVSGIESIDVSDSKSDS